MKKVIICFSFLLLLGGLCLQSGFADEISDLTKAAESGDADAQQLLGKAYELGEGTTQDYKTALKWYKKAAEQNNELAQFSLANLYYYGAQGLHQDYQEAFKWYKKAAVQGDILAQNMLMTMYERGQGVKQNNEMAYLWFIVAASIDANYQDPEYIQRKKELTSGLAQTQIDVIEKAAQICIESKYNNCTTESTQ